MDNTDFSFLWRKEMTRNWVARALADRSGGPADAAGPPAASRLKEFLNGGCPPRDPLLYCPPSRNRSPSKHAIRAAQKSDEFLREVGFSERRGGSEDVTPVSRILFR